MPALFLNGTSVERGNRIITSNLRLTNVFLDADDAASKLADHKLPATQTGRNIPLSTASHMSARFTFVSPAGRLPDGTHIVDGGYFENSGATTALEIATRIKDFCAAKKIADKIDLKVLMISNDPRKPSIAPANPAPEPAGPKRTRPVTVTGTFLGELLSPLYALMNTRDARGTYAQKAIQHEQRRVQADGSATDDEYDSAQPATRATLFISSVVTPRCPYRSAGCYRRLRPRTWNNSWIWTTMWSKTNQRSTRCCAHCRQPLEFFCHCVFRQRE